MKIFAMFECRKICLNFMKFEFAGFLYLRKYLDYVCSSVSDTGLVNDFFHYFQ